MQIGDKYFIQDIESGQLSQVSKEEHDQYQELVNRVHLSLAHTSGRVIAFGTPSQMVGKDNFKDMWMTSEGQRKMAFNVTRDPYYKD